MIGQPHEASRRFGGWRTLAFVVAVLAGASIWHLDWNLDGIGGVNGWAGGLAALRDLALALFTPDLSQSALAEGVALSLETLAMAVMGVAAGFLLAYVIALPASAAFAFPERKGQLRALRWVGRELARLLLDVLRAVPDFVWAVVMIPLVGAGPAAGFMGITLGIAGILGKIFSELWDNVHPQRYEALRALGCGTMSLHFYGVQPLASRSMISFVLMRTECAIRNASVTGIVGGGGLGSVMQEYIRYGIYDRVATLLYFTLILTIGADAIATLIRMNLRSQRDVGGVVENGSGLMADLRKRALAIGSVVATLGIALWYSGPKVAKGLASAFDPERIEQTRWLFGRLLNPDLSWQYLSIGFKATATPLGMAVLATLIATASAVVMAFGGSRMFQLSFHRFSGEAAAPFTLAIRRIVYGGTKFVALVFRAIPEVVWAMLFIAAFSVGPLAGVCALTLHSVGLLFRVFAERIDDVSTAVYERGLCGSRSKTFAYVGVPTCWKEWMTYAFFQFESNARMGVVLGMIGIGGLGQAFEIAWDNKLRPEWMEIAATMLIFMVLMTVVIDRVSRLLKVSRQ